MYPIDLADDDKGDWVIEARGRKFTPPRRTTLSPHAQAQRSMVYSPTRILHPMKRVDWDPEGERNTAEPRRLRVRGDQLGRGARPRHHRADPREARERPRLHPHHLQLAPPVGQPGLPPQRLLPLPQPDGHGPHGPQPGQLGGLALGRHADVGQQPPPRHPRAVRPARGRAQAHRDGRLLVVRPGVHRRRHLLRLREHLTPLLDEGARHQDGVRRSLLQPDRRALLRQVVRAAPRHRRRVRPRHRPHLAGRGPLRQGVRRRAHHRVRRVEGLRPRQDRQRAQDAGVGRERVRHPRPPDPRPGARVGHQEGHARRRRPRRLGRRLPLGHRQRVGAHHGGARRHAGLRQAGRQHLGHVPGRAVGLLVRVPRLRRGRHVRRPGEVGRRLPHALPHLRPRAPGCTRR